MSNLSIKRRETETVPMAEPLGPLRMMRRILGWDPFQQMSPFLATEEPGLTFMPAFEVKETKDSFEFRADIPGVNEDDIEITVTGNRLTISGSREAEVEDRSDRYFATERLYGSFVRTFTLPDGVDSEHVAASLANGVLCVSVPKKPESQPKKIAVTASHESAARESHEEQDRTPAHEAQTRQSPASSAPEEHEPQPEPTAQNKQ